MWCGGGHLHKGCPEKGNTALIPTCCNCKLVGGEELHPSNYRGSSHGKEELGKRKLQRAPKSTTGRMFSSNYTTPEQSFAAVLRSNTATAAASAAPGCTGLPHHSGRNECPPSLEAQPTTSTKAVSSGS
jgi:hypothetical protein